MKAQLTITMSNGVLASFWSSRIWIIVIVIVIATINPGTIAFNV
ncbi:hypothetical protein [Microbispora sp. NPDC049125]